MEKDLRSLFGLLCTAVPYSSDETPQLAPAPPPGPPPPPPAFGPRYEGAAGQPSLCHLETA